MTGADIAGQNIWQSMAAWSRTIWGHGSYVAPD
jgi:nitric oxide reductase large subunit